MSEKVVKSDAEWRKILAPEQFDVCRNKGTERAFTGIYWECNDEGVYRCACCESELFGSEAKYDSGTGWPSFTTPLDPERVRAQPDADHGLHRVEVVCSRCDSHLGHVFEDGPDPTGQRFCMNSCALDLERKSG